MKLFTKITIALILSTIFIISSMGAEDISNCKTNLICDGKICYCPDTKDKIVCKTLLTSKECYVDTPTDSKIYQVPIDCFRDKQYCDLKVDGETREYYLKKTDCNRTANHLCDLSYIERIK